MIKRLKLCAACILGICSMYPALSQAQDSPQVQPVAYQQSQPVTPKQQIGPQKESWGDRLILYFPNRFVDMADMVDLSLGFGPTVKAKLWATRYMAFGGGIGGSAKVIKAYNRQYGAGLESGWNASFMMLTSENTEMTDTTRGVQQYFNYYSGVPSLDNSVYNFWKGPQDMFSIGGQGAIFVEIDGEFHPFEAYDFLAGWFFLDPKGDDFTMADLQN